MNEDLKFEVREDFVDYINEVYFEGASESITPELLEFEYEQFCKIYNNNTPL